jgi:Protein of unknown function, DUF488
MVIQLKRAYDPPESDDGFRVLVDRLWLRGVSKSAARIDLWLKEIAPSAALRHLTSPTNFSIFRCHCAGSTPSSKIESVRRGPLQSLCEPNQKIQRRILYSPLDAAQILGGDLDTLSGLLWRLPFIHGLLPSYCRRRYAGSALNIALMEANE